MTSFWFLTLVSFAACAIVLPLVLFVARRWHLYVVAVPLDIHTQSIPRLGGVGILVGLLASLALSPAFRFRENLALLVALLVVWLTGLIDDLRHFRSGVRLLFQTSAALLLWWAGWQLPVPGPAVFSLFLTSFYVVLLINAFNMLDGADGLAGGVSGVIAMGFLLWFAGNANSLGAAVAAALLGGCLGFLLFNFPPAKIFMGDSGSLTLGFLIAFLSLEFYRRQPVPGLHWLVPLLFTALPILDLVFAVLRRLSKGLSPFTGDRQHFYDLLLQHGCSSRQVFFISSLGTAILVWLGWLFGRQELSALLPLLGLLALCLAFAALRPASST